uniref:PcfJ-like protein n=1 Tax=uncultured Bacillota bacterium TaxID=344338 RepID=A0A650EM70_9FIRM|nr:hypothetical protein Firmicute1046_0030 [uncultured Firmicutes bacterium]
MKKTLLKKLPLNPAPPKAVNLAKRLDGTEVKYLVRAAVRRIDRKQMLVLDFFDTDALLAGDTSIKLRSFIHKTDHISMDFRGETMKWRTAVLSNCINAANYYSRKQYVCLDDASYEILLRYTKPDSYPNPNDVIMRAEEIQRATLARRLRTKHAALEAKIDAKMAEVHSLSRKAGNWLKQDILPHYFFYEYARNLTSAQGRCTRCGHEVRLEKPRYNQERICPHCKAVLICKTVKKAKHFQDRGAAYILQKAGNQILMRYFRLYQTYANGELLYHNVYEDLRIFVSESEVSLYDWGDFKRTGKVRWRKCNTYQNIDYYAAVYTGNLKSVLHGTPWQYSMFDEYCRRTEFIGLPWMYLFRYLKYPQIEYLMKLGLYRITEDLVNNNGRHCNQAGKTPEEFLGVSAAGLKLLQETNASNDMLHTLQSIEKIGFKIRTKEDFIRFCSDFPSQYMQSLVFSIGKYTTLEKIRNYLRKQAGDKINNVSAWQDYLHLCETLDYDLTNPFVLFPKNLKQAHDKETERLNIKRELERRQRLSQLSKKCKGYLKELQECYGWEDDTYLIQAPKNLQAIVKEGHDLHHCVGSYAEQVAQGKKIILFLREKENPTKPFHTIELHNNEIVQCYGKFNKKSPQVDPFLKHYQHDVLQPLAKQMDLAAAS